MTEFSSVQRHFIFIDDPLRTSVWPLYTFGASSSLHGQHLLDWCRNSLYLADLGVVCIQIAGFRLHQSSHQSLVLRYSRIPPSSLAI